MPTVGPDRKPWPMNVEGGYTPTRWANVSALLTLAGFGYVVLGLVLGLPDRALLGVGALVLGLALVCEGFDSLFIKDVLPVGDFSPPDSIGAVIRLVSLAVVTVAQFLAGVGLLVGGALVLL